MIPKIIHYCWLSDSSMPEKAQKCMESWKKYLPDYEFILWNFSRFPKGKSVWVDQAFNSGKYAFAADYIRLFALYNYGGIYLDTDVEILKPYDDLLDLPYFIGQEKTPSGIEAATIGFPPGHSLIKQLLDRYNNRSFIKSDGSLDMEPIPYIIRRYIEAQYEYNVISNIADFSSDSKQFNVFSADFFSPKRWDTGEMEVSDNTYSIHHFAGSWLPQHINIKNKRVYSFVKIKVWIVHHLMRKNTVLISGDENDNRLYSKFALRHMGPLYMASVSAFDFEKMKINKELFVENNLCFISRNDSKIKIAANDFYPIAVVGNTDIEIHFTLCYSREQALESWNKGVQNMHLYNPVFLCDNTSPTRVKDYLICAKINLGINVIH